MRWEDDKECQVSKDMMNGGERWLFWRHITCSDWTKAL